MYSKGSSSSIRVLQGVRGSAFWIGGFLKSHLGPDIGKRRSGDLWLWGWV